jgi:DNA-binding GntR family transcriptional regulator
LDDSVTVLKRIRSIKKHPVVLLENHLPTEIAKHLPQKDVLKKSVLKILKDKIDLPVGRGEFYVEAIPAEPDIAEILKAELFEPVISVKVYYWFTDEKPFEIVNCFTRAEYFKYKGSISASQFKDI